MKSYAARMKEAEKVAISALTDDITAEFAAILANYGFTKITHEHDRT